MADPLLQLADEIVDLINREAWPLAFEARRTFRVDDDLSQLNGLRVLVVPAGDETIFADRQSPDHEVELHVAVQQRIDDIDEDRELQSQDAVIELARSIETFVADAGLESPAFLVKSVSSPIFYPPHLLQHGVLTSVMRQTFRLFDD